MVLRNRALLSEWAAGMLVAVIAGVCFGFGSGLWLGIGIFLICGALAGMHLLWSRKRYLEIRELSERLERLLHNGQMLAVEDYREGELSILASQIQKLTVRLTEAARVSQADRQYLADSLADISHQLRTPLTAMNLTASMLSAPELQPEKHHALVRELRTLLGRTQWLIETLLKLSKLDAGTVELKPQSIPSEELIRKALAPLVIPAELKELRLEVDGGGASVYVDPQWTTEAIGNLLKNAIEHTPRGGLIRILYCENALFSQVIVEDTGGGFDPEDIPHLFERFYKGKNAAPESCGIGLALSRSIIAAQNGTIQASNTPEGARFTVKFYKRLI